MLPSARRVSALANATDPFSKPFLEQIQLGGEATETAINPIRISNSEEFESAFAAMERDRPDAIIVQPSLPSKRAAELALQHRVPAVSVPRWFADEGGRTPRYMRTFFTRLPSTSTKSSKAPNLPVCRSSSQLVSNLSSI